MKKRIYYSQNFTNNNNLIRSLILKSSITSNDLVLDIGAGLGIITKELLDVGSKVIAIEIDEILSRKLKERLRLNKNLEVLNGDFLRYSLPTTPYKVFSNIPFNITSEVIKKLVFSPNPPIDSYIIVQKETVARYIGKPFDYKNSQISILLKPWFKMSVVHEFKRNDFYPIPNVDCLLMRIEKRINPLINESNKKLFYDLVSYTNNQRKSGIKEGLSKVINKSEIKKLACLHEFNLNRKPSELELDDWIAILNHVLNYSSEAQKRIIIGTYNRLNKLQEGIIKINRTRLDENWRRMG